MFRIDTNALSPSKEREPLFEIDGVEYTIPKTVGGEIGLIATRIAAEEGELRGQMYAIEQTIGMEAYNALCAVEGLPKKTVAAILEICRERVFGAAEEQGKG